LDEPAVAIKKIMSAVTDSIGIIRYDEVNQPGIANLLTIHSVLSKESIEDIVERFSNHGYGDLKKEIGQLVFDFLSELQDRFKEIKNSGIVDEVLRQGKEQAEQIAYKKIRKVKRKVGFEIVK